MQKINERIFDLRKTVIEPNGKNLQYWRDIWNYRELAYNLAKRDITVRYKQTRIGLGWAVIAPIISMFVSTFIFGTLAGLSSDGNAPYFIMVYAGSIPWAIFQGNVLQTSSTFITNAALMKKVYYPRILCRGNRVSSEGIGFYPVLHMERTRNIVAIEIRTEKHGTYLSVHCNMLPYCFLFSEKLLMPYEEGVRRPYLAPVVRALLAVIVE